MGLIKCSECGHEISSLAETCPNCGAPVSNNYYDESIKTENKFAKTGNIFLGISVIFNILGIFSILAIIYGGLAMSESERINSGKKNAVLLIVFGILITLYQYFLAPVLTISMI